MTTALSASPIHGRLVVIRTGLPALDGLFGGFPRGRVSEISGEPCSGKRTVAFTAAALCRATGGRAFYLDGEQVGDDRRWARALRMIEGRGSDVLIDAAPTAEETLEQIEGLVRDDADIVVATGLPTSLLWAAELDGKLHTKPNAERRAGLFKSFLQHMTPVLKRNGTALVLISQLRECLKGRGGVLRPPCDRILQRHAWLRLRTELLSGGRLTRRESVVDDDRHAPVGSLHRIRVMKQGSGVRNESAEFGIEFAPSPGMFQMTGDTRCDPDEELEWR